MNPSGIQPSFSPRIKTRQVWGKIWQAALAITTAVSVLFLLLLLGTVLDQSFGYVAIATKVNPAELVSDGRPLEALNSTELTAILTGKLSANRLKTLEAEKPLAERSQADLLKLVNNEVLKPTVVKTWPLFYSIFQPTRVHEEAAALAPEATLQFKNWLTFDFVTSPQSSKPLEAGVRTALLGSIWTILVTILVAFPIGVGAALYLEEYARDTGFNRLIQTNINNLAGVPSIIYGMLGLAIFVRTLAPITSGAVFNANVSDASNGRTLLSAGLTLALLVLPLIIINTQEAVKAVPDSLRQASYALGATQWQTIWHHVLKNAIPGILTGTILAISRAIGETAPLVVVGAATYITFDPNNVFSKFTTLPIQIYQWSSRPQAEFQNIAGAAILVLLILLLSLNSFAILMRNRYRK